MSLCTPPRLQPYLCDHPLPAVLPSPAFEGTHGSRCLDMSCFFPGAAGSPGQWSVLGPQGLRVLTTPAVHRGLASDPRGSQAIRWETPMLHTTFAGPQMHPSFLRELKKVNKKPSLCALPILHILAFRSPLKILPFDLRIKNCFICRQVGLRAEVRLLEL